MSNRTKTLFFLLFSILLLQSCDSNKNDTPTDEQIAAPISISTPNFDADTAFYFIEKQLSFGFRTPGSEGQKKCAAWMSEQLTAVCDTVYQQYTTVTGGDGSKLPCFNLIGAINPNAKHRILLLTHWDSRPWADQDDSAQTKPIMAADDAASGVGILLELAKKMKLKPLPTDLGIDIFFTDVEDYGKNEWGENSYCLGTQHWARNPHVAGYTAEFGILLDMVGSKGASFPMEMFSEQYAAAVQRNVYEAAQRAGYSSYFPYTKIGYITDDHKFVNEMAHIPTVDIIHLSQSSKTGFAPHWHTHDDNINIIDKATLKAVGQTLLQVIYERAAQTNSPS